MYESLQSLGYRRLIEEDRYGPQELGALNSASKHVLPMEFIQFLTEYPESGCFGAEIVCQGLEPEEGAPDCIYPISLLYAFCSRREYDLRAIISESSPEQREWIPIADDVFGNMFVMSLRKDDAGHIYFKSIGNDFGEEKPLISGGYKSFISALRVSE